MPSRRFSSGALFRCRLSLFLEVLELLLVATLLGIDVAPVSRHFFSVDLHNLHSENQHVATLDLAALAPIAVAKLGGDVHLPLVTLNHQLHRLSPAFDHLVGRKRRGAATLVSGVE